MKTTGKSTSAVVLIASAILMPGPQKRQLSPYLSALVAMHMDRPGEYDDWKSSSERTLSVP